MSRFSKAEAEALGWVIVHERPEEREIVGGTVKIIPASVRAEKFAANGQHLTEEAESIGLLLERINAYESFQARINSPVEVGVFESEAPLDESGLPLRSVDTPEGRLTDGEFSARASAQAQAADDASQKLARDEEDERSSAPQEFETEQLVVESDRRTGDIATVREGEKSLDEAQARKDLEEADQESERVVAASEAQGALKAAEEAQGEPDPED
jgi:hypothetical protein